MYFYFLFLSVFDQLDSYLLCCLVPPKELYLFLGYKWICSLDLFIKSHVLFISNLFALTLIFVYSFLLFSSGDNIDNNSSYHCWIATTHQALSHDKHSVILRWVLPSPFHRWRNWGNRQVTNNNSNNLQILFFLI